jgi:hypothetical protein
MQRDQGAAIEFLTEEALPETARAFLESGPRRRKADDREHFEAVAAVYRAACSRPGRKRPTEAVKEQFSVSHSSATKWVHRARELGLLPPTTPGRVGEAIKAPETHRKRGRR